MLLADEGRPDKDVSETLRVSKYTVNRIRKRYCEDDLDFALHEKTHSDATLKLDGKMEAQLTLLTCYESLDRRLKWTLGILANKLVEMVVVDSIFHISVQRLLKKSIMQIL